MGSFARFGIRMLAHGIPRDGRDGTDGPGPVGLSGATDPMSDVCVVLQTLAFFTEQCRNNLRVIEKRGGPMVLLRERPS